MTLRAHLVRNEKCILIQLHQKVPCQHRQSFTFLPGGAPTGRP